MRVELDSVLGVVEVDGVKISLELLKSLANPDPHKTYCMKRDGNDVTVMETTAA